MFDPTELKTLQSDMGKKKIDEKRVDSLERTLMLEGIGGRRRRG